MALQLVVYAIFVVYFGKAQELCCGGTHRFDFKIESCQLVYNQDNLSDLGINILPHQLKCDSMPCDCNQELFDNFLKGLRSGYRLSWYSYINYTLLTPQYEDKLRKFKNFTFTMGTRQNSAMNPDKSYIELYDADNDAWIRPKGAQIFTPHVGKNTFYQLIQQPNNPPIVFNKIRIYMEWDGTTSVDNSAAKLGTITIDGPLLWTNGEGSISPTTDPTTVPTSEPSYEPTTEPTKNPTSDPTRDPTTEPTLMPTEAPTWWSVEKKTERIIDPADGNVDSYQFHSNNVIPLSERSDYNKSAPFYILPNQVNPDGSVKPGKERPFNLTAVLAWADIDASIELEGCPQNDTNGNPLWDWNSTNPRDPKSFYNCDNGTWLGSLCCQNSYMGCFF